MRQVCVIGLGYIGLPTACVIASNGYQVLGVDINPDVVQIVNTCTTTFKEPGLNEYLLRAVHSHALRATLEPEPVDVFIITVPTPILEDKSPDMSFVRAAVHSIAPHVHAGGLVVLESSSPVGTTEKIRQWLVEDRGRADDLFIAYSPERIIPGNMLQELLYNDRIVGGLTPHATRLAAEFYRNFVKGRVYETDSRMAELTKLAENSYRDVNIAFANELSLIAEKNGVDPWQLIRFTNCHPRVNILQPGAGVGGHCIAIDPWFLVSDNPDEAKLIKQAREVNLRKTDWVYERVSDTAARMPAPVIACLGLAYMSDTEDLRESPALEITRRLSLLTGVTVISCEPNCETIPDVTLLPLEEAVAAADIVVFLVKHREFSLIQPESLAGKYVFDICGVFSA